MILVDFHICHTILAVGCVCYSCMLCFHLFFGGLFVKWKLDRLACYLLEFQSGGMWPFLVHWQAQSCYKISYFVVSTDMRPRLSLILLNSRRTIQDVEGKSGLMRLSVVLLPWKGLKELTAGDDLPEHAYRFPWGGGFSCPHNNMSCLQQSPCWVLE